MLVIYWTFLVKFNSFHEKTFIICSRDVNTKGKTTFPEHFSIHTWMLLKSVHSCSIFKHLKEGSSPQKTFGLYVLSRKGPSPVLNVIYKPQNEEEFKINHNLWHGSVASSSEHYFMDSFLSTLNRNPSFSVCEVASAVYKWCTLLLKSAVVPLPACGSGIVVSAHGHSSALLLKGAFPKQNCSEWIQHSLVCF